MVKPMNKIITDLKEKLNTEKVLVACSTGVDSMVLLHLVLNAIDPTQIVVAHVNHGKREQSVIEEEYITEFSKEKNIKCYVKRLGHIDNGNFQSIARKMRYEFFEEICEKENIKYILLAHHANDNLETIIMRMLKSSSLKGYAGIEKESIYHNYIIYRPLITISKKEIIDYSIKHNIKYYEDSSNSELDYTRNRIRHLITPILLEENPNLYSAINYYSETLLNANEIIEKEETSFIKNKIMVNNKNGILTYTLNMDDYLMLPTFYKKQILFRLLKKYSLSHQCIEDIMKKITSNKTNIVSKINNELSLIKEYNQILFTEEDISNINYYLEARNEGIYDLPNNGKLVVNKNNCNFITTNKELCYNIERLPVIIRNREAGDKIANKLVSDFITKKKIPYLIKKDILLLCDENNNILAVLGYKGGK